MVTIRGRTENRRGSRSAYEEKGGAVEKFARCAVKEEGEKIRRGNRQVTLASS